MAKALVVYATRTNQTLKIAELIAEGLRFSGHEVVLKKISEIKSEADLQGYDAYAFGSATYHGEMMNSMKQLLFLAEKAGLEGKCGGAFGSYGLVWRSPGAHLKHHETRLENERHRRLPAAKISRAGWSHSHGSIIRKGHGL